VLEIAIGAIHAIGVHVAWRPKMNEKTRRSYDSFAETLWEVHFEQSRRKHAMQDAEDVLKAAADAWKEAAAPEIVGNLGRGFYEKIHLDISRFKP